MNALLANLTKNLLSSFFFPRFYQNKCLQFTK